MPEIVHHCPGVPFLLVGTKADCRDNEEIVKKLGNKDCRGHEETASNKATANQISCIRGGLEIPITKSLLGNNLF